MKRYFSVPNETGVILTDICLQAAKFLQDASRAHGFDNQANGYYNVLVQKLLELVERILKDNQNDAALVKRIYKLISEVIKPATPALKELGMAHYAQALIKWHSILATSHPELAKLVEAEISQMVPALHDDALARLKENPDYDDFNFNSFQ